MFTAVLALLMWQTRSDLSGGVVVTDDAKRFDMSAAFKTLYGSDGDKANSTVPARPKVNLEGSGIESGDPLIVRPFWSKTYVEDGVLRAVLLTYAVPVEPNSPMVPGDKPFSCHACAPLIGLATFRSTSGKWMPEVSEIAVSRGGGWGLPPGPVRLLKIGPHHLAVQIELQYVGGGTTTTSEEVVPFYRSTISKPLDILTAEDNRGGCADRKPSDEPACYGYKRTLALRPGRNPDYYDIHAVLHGTDYGNGRSEGTRPVDGTEVFRFRDDAYRLIMRRGSIPQTEGVLQHDK